VQLKEVEILGGVNRTSKLEGYPNAPKLD